MTTNPDPGPFTNPRPSKELQEAAAKLVKLCRAEGFTSATVHDGLYGIHDYSSVTLNTGNPTTGREMDCDDGRVIATYKDESTAGGLREFTVIGPAYRDDKAS